MVAPVIDLISGDHGPECALRFGTERGRRSDDCHCVVCHCRVFVPGGFLNACLNCGRPRFENGSVVR